MSQRRKIRHFTALWALLAVLLTAAVALVSCTSGAGVSPACVGYYAGTDNLISYNWHGEDQLILPPEMIRCFALYTVLENSNSSEDTAAQQDLAAQILYRFQPAYMKTVVMLAGTAPEGFLSKMNERAAALGLSATTFGSITGAEKSEKALWALFSESDGEPSFSVSRSDLADLQKMAVLFHESPALSAILSTNHWSFTGISATQTRTGYLLNDQSELYLQSTVLYLSGQGYDKEGAAIRVAMAGVEENGALSFSAVAVCGTNCDLEMYASCDAGNLCGKVLQKNYRLSYLPDKAVTNEKGGSWFVGMDFFFRVIVFLLPVLGGLLLLLIITSTVLRFKRNIAGRKKYCRDSKELAHGESANEETVEQKQLEDRLTESQSNEENSKK